MQIFWGGGNVTKMDFLRLLNSLNAIRVAYILIKNVLPRTPVSRPQYAPHGFD